MKIKSIIYIFCGCLFSLIACLGLFKLFETSSLDITSLVSILIVPGLFLLYKGVRFKSSEVEDISYGGICKTCGDWCEVIYYEGQECCDCIDELPINDRCPICYEKSQEKMS